MLREDLQSSSYITVHTHFLYTSYTLPIHFLYTPYTLPIHFLYTSNITVHTHTTNTRASSMLGTALLRVHSL